MRFGKKCVSGKNAFREKMRFGKKCVSGKNVFREKLHWAETQT
jgi:hypothetical protein